MAARKRGSRGTKVARKSTKKSSVRSSRTARDTSHKGAKGRSKRGTAAPLVYDRAMGRWRRGGRFAAPPLASKVRRDKVGRPIDGAGRLVPAHAVRGEEKRVARLKALARIPTPPFEQVERGKVPYAPEIQRKAVKPIRRYPGELIVDKELVSSSFVNRAEPSKAHEVLENTLIASAKKGPFEPEDVPIYQWGLKFVGDKPLSGDMLASLTSLLPKDTTLEYADTKAGTEVYVKFNTAKEPLLIDDVKGKYAETDTHNRMLSIYQELYDYWDELIDWYAWFETEEALYDK